MFLEHVGACDHRSDSGLTTDCAVSGFVKLYRDPNGNSKRPV
jgi:hypothetical protein